MDVLQRVRPVINVEQMIQSLRLEFEGLGDPARTQLPPELVQRVSAAPARIRGRLEKLLVDGFDKIAAVTLRSGENPFPISGSKQMHLAGELLLKGSFTKRQFREDCRLVFGWTYRTASTETSLAIALLRGLGLVEERGGCLHASL